MTTCAVPGRPHQAVSGLHLCEKHLDEISEWLHDIEREWKKLDATPAMQANWNGARGGRLASHQVPARINSIVLNDPRRVEVRDLEYAVGSGLTGLDDTLSAFGTLHVWAEMVRHGRGLTPPGQWRVQQFTPGPLCAGRCEHTSCRRMTYRYYEPDEQTVSTERQILSRHLDWLALQPSIGDLWADLRTLRVQLQATNGTSDPGPIPGRCPRLVDGRDCGGRLWPVKPQHSSDTFVHTGPALVQAIECESNSTHRWEDKHLIRLSLILEEQQREERERR